MQNNEKWGLQVFLRNSLLVFIDILETQTTYIIPQVVNCLVISIHFIQLLSNIFDFTNSDNMIISYMSEIAQGTTLTYLLYLTNSSLRSWIFYALSHSLLYFMFGFVFVLAYQKYANPIRFQEKSFLELKIKEILSTYLAWNFYFFLEPYIKINMGIIIPGHKCLLAEHRGLEQSFTNGYAMVIGIVGLSSNILLTCLTMYFFRNFEFHDTNVFKRKHSITLYLIILVRVVISIIFTMGSSNLSGVLHILSHIFGLVSIYDALTIRPFLNQVICKYYILAAMLYEIATISISIYEFSSIFGPLSIIYTFIWLGPLIGYLAMLIYERSYNRSLFIMPQTIKFNTEYFDLYSEEFLRLFKDSQQNDESKFKVLKMFRYHIIECKSPECFCVVYGTENLEGKHARAMFKEVYVYADINQRVIKNVVITMPLLIKLVDSMFKVALETHEVLVNQQNYENLSLKYISFIHKYMENSLLSYFFIKKLGKNQENLSFFFSLLFEVYSDKLKAQMRQMNQSLTNSRSLDGNKYFVETVQQVEEFTEQFTSQILQVIQIKQRIWEYFFKGSNTMDQLYGSVLRQVNLILQLQQNITWQFKSCFLLTSQAALSINSAYLKLHQIYSLFLMNDFVQVKKMESKILEFRKRDQYKEELFLNNHNYMQGSSVIIKAGISLENGKILNKQNIKIAEFFGYSAHEMEQLKTINDLMPGHIARLHNQILAQYLTKGYSQLMTTSRKIFLINKEQFLFPVSICVRNDYTSLSDCVFNACLLKVSSNKELIMFDEYGTIISMTKPFFNSICKNRQQHVELFTYEQLKNNGLLYLLCPSLIKIFQSNLKSMNDQEKMDDVVSYPIVNLQCSLFTNEQTIDFCSEYMHKKTQKTQKTNVSKSQKINQSSLFQQANYQSQESQNTQRRMDSLRPSLVKLEDLAELKRYIYFNKSYYTNSSSLQRFKMRFTLHVSYRNFANIDNRVLKAVVGQSRQSSTLYSCMRYYVIECQEVFKTKLRQFTENFETMRSEYQFQPMMVQSQIVHDEEINIKKQSSPASSNNFEISNISERKHTLNINCDDGDVSQREDLSEIHQINQIINVSEAYASIEQNIPQIDSPKGDEQKNLMNEQLSSLDQRKRSLLDKMVQFEKKFEQKIKSEDNPVFFSKVKLTNQEHWPEPLIEVDQQSVDKQKQEIDIDEDSNHSKSKKEEDEVNSYNEDSNDEIEDNEKFSDRRVKKHEEENLKRAKFDADISSQNSRFSQSGGQSITEIYLNHKMPSKYPQFLVTMVIFLLSVLISMVAMIAICTVGFNEIGYFNQYIDTAYLLHSHFNEAVLGSYYQKLNEIGLLPYNKKFDCSNLFQRYQNESVMQMINSIQSHFSLITQASSQNEILDTPQFLNSTNLVINQVELITYYNNQIEMMIRSQNDPIALRSLLLRTDTNLQITIYLNSLILNTLRQLENGIVSNFFLIFYLLGSLMIILLFFMVISSINFQSFQEKVLLLVTRVNLQEYEIEQMKLVFAKNLLKEMSGSQIVTNDFVPDLVYFSFNSRDRKVFKAEMESAKPTKQKKQSIFVNLIQNKVAKMNGSQHQSKGNILSTKIYNPKLSNKFQVIQLIVVINFAILYLIGGIIFALQVPSQYMTLSQNTINSIQSYASLQSMNIYVELLISSHLVSKITYNIDQPDENILGFQRNYVYQEYNNLRNKYQTFMGQQNDLISTFSSSGDLSLINFNNLCLIQPKTQFYQNVCSSSLEKFYSKGVQGIFTQLSQHNIFKKFYIQVTSLQVIIVFQHHLRMRVQLKISLDKMITGRLWLIFSLLRKIIQSVKFILFLLKQKEILSYSKNDLINLTTTLNTSLIQYLIITGSMLIVLLSVYFYHFVHSKIFQNKKLQELHQNISCVEYLLTFLPADKLAEATTIQMLKAIQNY